ncbi:unnamed protein product [Closterium sp. Yama58-4]|nr:unnamed protein product [Closterium sp. Yama58-4]
MEADLIAARFELDELHPKITSALPPSDAENSKASRRMAMRLLVGDMDSNNGTSGPYPMAAMGEMKRGKPPVNNGRVSPRTAGQVPPQKKPAGAPKKKVVKKAVLPKAPAGDPMEEFFAIMEQFVDEPEEMECVRLAEVSRANKTASRMQKPQMGASFDGFPTDLGLPKSGVMEKQTHSGPMALAPASPKMLQKTQLPRAASRDSEKSRVQSVHARTHSAGGLNLNSLWNTPASPGVKGAPIQRANSVRASNEMQSLVDALKAEIRAKDKLLEASEKEQQMLQEELKHAWLNSDELQRQLNDAEALVSKLQHENEVLRSAKRVLTTSPTDLSRRLAATESRNVELAEKLAAREKELEMTKIALQQAAQERDSLAEEMEAALASWAVDSPATPASGTSSGTFSHSTSTSSSSQDEVQQLAMALDGVQRELRVVRGERDALMAAVRPSGRVNVNNPAGRSLRKSSSALSVSQHQQPQTGAAQFNYKAIRQTVDSNPRVHFAEPIASRLPLASSAPC